MIHTCTFISDLKHGNAYNQAAWKAWWHQFFHRYFSIFKLYDFRSIRCVCISAFEIYCSLFLARGQFLTLKPMRQGSRLETPRTKFLMPHRDCVHLVEILPVPGKYPRWRSQGRSCLATQGSRFWFICESLGPNWFSEIIDGLQSFGWKLAGDRLSPFYTEHFKESDGPKKSIRLSFSSPFHNNYNHSHNNPPKQQHIQCEMP